jgi:cyclic beta-1,2-glucan synthetase
VLSNGRLTTIVRSDGTGATLLQGAAITAFQERATKKQQGLVFFFKDLDGTDIWSSSAGWSKEAELAKRFEWKPGEILLRWRRDELTIQMRVMIDAADPIEYRVIEIQNSGNRSRRIQVTSYLEPVLQDPVAHASHPEFSKLFVQTEFLSESRALLARRRQRDPEHQHPVAAHLFVGQPASEWETDRVRFCGRTPGARWPKAVTDAGPLSARTGDILDPVLSLRTVLEVEPNSSRVFTSALIAASDHAEAVRLARELHAVSDPSSLFVRALRGSEDELRRLELSVSQAESLQMLASGMLQGDRRLRAASEVLKRARGRLDELERFGFSTRRRLAVVHVGGDGDVRRDEARRAHRYWKSLGLPLDLALLCDAEPSRETRARDAEPMEIATSTLTPRQFDLLHACAYLVVQDNWPRPDELPDSRASDAQEEASTLRIGPRSIPPSTMWPQRVERSESLAFFNGIGGFTESGREYVMRIPIDEVGGTLPPRPWVNVVGHESFGFLISETGAGNTWSVNSRERRLSPWLNDPLCDPHAEAVFVRDEDTGEHWSPMPGPAPGPGEYEVRHGFGYTRFHVKTQELVQECLVYAMRQDPVKVTAVRLTNVSGRVRRLSVYAYQELVLGSGIDDASRFIVSSCDGETDALLARNPVDSTGGTRFAFAAALGTRHATGRYVTADQASFVGELGDIARPKALRSENLDNRVGVGLSPCFAQQVVIEIAPGEVAQIDFLFGEERTMEAAGRLIERLTTPGAIDTGWRDLQEFWEERLSRVEISTPSAPLDRMVNGWLPYQILSCRLWGRTALYQSGGAFGFRDQLQDAASLVMPWPEFTRRQIVLHAAHQFVEGDVLHWWHPPEDVGIRTRFVDDLLWLPHVVAEYVHATGDRALLGEVTPFVVGPELPRDSDEMFQQPRLSEESADIYEHCCRALDRSLLVGSHGLPLFGAGDWNDGMNRVGRAGRGESVWMAQFLFATLGDFLPFCEQRADDERARLYADHRQRLKAAIDAAWDGDWYRRGYYDDGQPLGSRESDECQIDALTQAWAVISGSGAPERVGRALESVERHLISEADGIIRLLTPPFDKGSHDPGYIKGYVAGVRENGGQYTHAALWVVKAMALLRRHDRVATLLEMLTPIHHTRTPETVDRYRLEPYVVAGDVYGVAPHVGQGGWSWYTGAAGLMYRAALESLLGIQLVEGEALVLSPCVPHDWPEFSVRYRLPDAETTYEILVQNPTGNAASVRQASVDGVALLIEGANCRIPLVQDGALHRVTVLLGGAEGPS